MKWWYENVNRKTGRTGNKIAFLQKKTAYMFFYNNNGWSGFLGKYLYV